VVAHHLAVVGDIRSRYQQLVDDQLRLARTIVDGETAACLMYKHSSHVIAINPSELGPLLDGAVGWL
jgi:hypothetical protein